MKSHTEITSRVKFYADTPLGQKNKLFTFSVPGMPGIPRLLANFIAKGFRIKAVYYEYLKNGKLIDNIRITSAFHT